MIKLDPDKLIQVIEFLKENKEKGMMDFPSKYLTAELGFPSSNYTDRLCNLKDSNPLKVIERYKDKDGITFSYSGGETYPKDELIAWAKSLNKKAKRKQPRAFKLDPEPKPLPEHDQAIESLTALIAENIELKAKLDKITKILEG